MILSSHTLLPPPNYYLQPVRAQFGIGGKKKQGTKFQDLQEQATEGSAAAAAGGLGALGGLDMGDMDLAKMQEMMAEAMNDPETMKAFEEMGDQFGSAMEGLASMSPEALAQQMEDAMKMLTDDSLVDSILENKAEVLKQIEESGTVPPEELARFKSDPAYFELKMRESFDQMKDIFDDPEMMKSMTDAMSGMQDMMGDPDMMKNMLGDFTSDEKIEEARLELLSGDNPTLTAMFDTPEMQGILKDPKKFRDTVKEGQQGMMGDEL